MDHTDREILMHLQEYARVSMTELGKMIGLTSQAVAERVKKLEEKGIIKGYRAVIDAARINKQITAFILFDSNRCKQFSQFCRSHPDVVECHRLTGEYSYLIKVVTETVHTLEEFIDAAMEFGKSSTLITLSSPVENKNLV